ncbi:MAG: hypothetical protein ACYC6N_30805 [Pirellulaceae bacterium]
MGLRLASGRLTRSEPWRSLVIEGQVRQDFSSDPGWDNWNNRIEAENCPTVVEDFGWSPRNETISYLALLLLACASHNAVVAQTAGDVSLIASSYFLSPEIQTHWS